MKSIPPKLDAPDRTHAVTIALKGAFSTFNRHTLSARAVRAGWVCYGHRSLIQPIADASKIPYNGVFKNDAMMLSAEGIS